MDEVIKFIVISGVMDEFRIGISTGCSNSCELISRRDSSTLKVLVKGQNIYIWVIKI